LTGVRESGRNKRTFVYPGQVVESRSRTRRWGRLRSTAPANKEQRRSTHEHRHEHGTSQSLEQWLSRLEDLEAIKHLRYQYAGYCDSKYDPDGITSLFVPEGHWFVTGVGGEATGPAEMREFFTNMAQSIVWAPHFIMAPQIDVAEDGLTAQGRFYLRCFCTILRADDPSKSDAVVLTGNYVDQFIKEDGRWQFKELTGVVHQASEWTKGWVEQQWLG
jgi:SnoaL-like domain